MYGIIIYSLAIEDEIERKAKEEAKLKAEEEAKHLEEVAQMLSQKGWAVVKQETGPSASSSELVESQALAPAKKRKGGGGRPKGSVGLKNHRFQSVHAGEVDAVINSLVCRYL